MTVREYIGARYVPLFMGDWDNSETYEPLSIVQNEGNSYTSKQYVPTGIEITNEIYWAETGSYNAQVEAYRQEVLSYVDSISALDGKIDRTSTTLDAKIDSTSTTLDAKIDATIGLFNVCNYGADASGEEYSNEGIIAAAVAADGKGDLYFPSGTYKLSEPIDLTEYDIHSVYGDNAYITTDSVNTLDYFLKPLQQNLYPHKEHAHTIQGFTFEGNGKVKACIIATQQISISDCYFTNFTEYGIKSDNAQGLRVYDCGFDNDVTLYQNAIGLQCDNDNQIENCRFFGMKTAIECSSGNNVFNDIYIWCKEAEFETTGIKSPNYYLSALFSNIYFDTLNYPTENISGLFNNCLFLYNENHNNDHNYMIQKTNYTGGAVTGIFNNCSFQSINSFDFTNFTPYSNDKLSYHTYGCMFSQGMLNNRNALLNIYKTANPEDGLFRSTYSAFTNTSKWYKLARAIPQINAGTSNYFFEFVVNLTSTGRGCRVKYATNDNKVYVEDLISTQTLSTVFDFGVIKNSNYIDIFVKPKESLNQELYISQLFGGHLLNAFYMDAGESTYVTSDMTATSIE